MRTKKPTMTDDEILQTVQHYDLVDTALCYTLYDVCNGNLLSETTMLNFMCWLNLRPTTPPHHGCAWREDSVLLFHKGHL